MWQLLFTNYFALFQHSEATLIYNLCMTLSQRKVIFPIMCRVSFWLDSKSVPARVSLGVTTLLTMSTQTASINNSLPPVAYTKAIDVWQVGSTEYENHQNYFSNWAKQRPLSFIFIVHKLVTKSINWSLKKRTDVVLRIRNQSHKMDDSTELRLPTSLTRLGDLDFGPLF